MAKEASVLTIDRTKISYCARNSTAVLTYPFPPDVVRDLDVVNKEALITQLTAFIDTNKIPPANTIIILTDDILFEKDIVQLPSGPATNPTQQKVPSKPKIDSKTQQTISDEEIIRFIDTVPFEHVASKVYSIPNGVKVVAANRDLYETVKIVLEGKTFLVDAVVPLFVLGKMTGPLVLNPSVVRQIAGRVVTLRQQSLPLHFVIDTPKPPEEKAFSLTISNKGTDKKRLGVMAGVFVLLFGVMVTMYLNMTAQNQTLTTHASPKTIAPSVPAVFLSPTVITSTVAPTVAQVDITTKIQILANTNASNAAALKNNLTLDGFTNITVAKQAGSTSGKILIIFSHDVLQATRDTISTEVQKLFPAIVIQEGTPSQTGVTISL